MDEDEELYREMNEEDPYYMGEPEDDGDDNDDDSGKYRREPASSPHSKMTAKERKMQKKLDLFWNIVSGIALVGFLWWLFS